MNVGLVIVMGISIVFVGLLCIVFLCMGMSALVAMTEKKGSDNANQAPAAVSNMAVSKTAAPDPGPRGEVVAAIAAVLAEELGEDVSAIRILSLKKVN